MKKLEKGDSCSGYVKKGTSDSSRGARRWETSASLPEKGLEFV